MREWLVIEDSRKNSIFAPEKTILGYIPRDVVENELGIEIRDGTQFFTKEQGEAMKAHPAWREDEPT